MTLGLLEIPSNVNIRVDDAIECSKSSLCFVHWLYQNDTIHGFRKFLIVYTSRFDALQCLLAR